MTLNKLIAEIQHADGEAKAVAFQKTAKYIHKNYPKEQQEQLLALLQNQNYDALLAATTKKKDTNTTLFIIISIILLIIIGYFVYTLFVK
jgi:ADP-heptose:LPS heptosyltransferase